MKQTSLVLIRPNVNDVGINIHFYWFILDTSINSSMGCSKQGVCLLTTFIHLKYDDHPLNITCSILFLIPMARCLYMEEVVVIPAGCKVELNNKIFSFTGTLGSQSYDISRFNFTFVVENDKIVIILCQNLHFFRPKWLLEAARGC